VLEKVAIFIIFLGPLVFFHELGHFLFARLAGVRVETFSIGFGPKLFSFKRGDTVYAFSLIPLGGYVKMFGDDPLSEDKLTEEEIKVAYTHKSKIARFWIVFGGPLANFIFAFVIYFALVSFGEKVPETNFGVLKTDSALFKSGFRTGDTLVKINDHEILSFDDLNMIDSKISNITVERAGSQKVIDYNSKGMKFLELFSTSASPLRAPVLVNSNKDKFVITVNHKLFSYDELKQLNPKTFEVTKLTTDLPVEFTKEFFEKEKLETQLVSNQNLNSYITNNSLFPIDLRIKNITMGSPAEQSKLKKNDIIIKIDGESLSSFVDLKEKVQALKDKKEITVTYLDASGESDVKVIPLRKEVNGKVIMSIGIESDISFLSMMIEVKTEGLFAGINKAIFRTYDGTIKTFLGFKKLVTGEVSLKHVGGPLAIGKVAADSFDISLSMFFRLMALISINLGVINLFPIPVLDGGHIVFLFLELVNGGPLSRKKMMYAQQVGMSMLFLLIFVALFNDISRFF
jgi:regulator of sigma E protease